MKISILIGIAITVIAIVFGPYSLTLFSENSFCARELQIILKEYHVQAALNRAASAGLIINPRRIDPSSCCRIDKGGGDIPRLTWENYVTKGETYWVHIPIKLASAQKQLQMTLNGGQSADDMPVLMTNCGTVTEYD